MKARASYPEAASMSPISTASMARSGTHSIRRQQTRCQRQLPWVRTVSWGTSTPSISSGEKHTGLPSAAHRPTRHTATPR